MNTISHIEGNTCNYISPEVTVLALESECPILAMSTEELEYDDEVMDL